MKKNNEKKKTPLIKSSKPDIRIRTTPKVTSFDLKHKKPVAYPLHRRRLYTDPLI